MHHRSAVWSVVMAGVPVSDRPAMAYLPSTTQAVGSSSRRTVWMGQSLTPLHDGIVHHVPENVVGHQAES